MNYDKQHDYNEIEISPFVKSISLHLNVPVNFDYKKEIVKILIEKYI